MPVGIYVRTEEAKKNMRLAKLKNPTRYWLGKKRSPETCQKIRLANIDLKHSEETKRKISFSTNKGSKSCHWKGDKVGYSALHRWVSLKLGNPQVCDECGTTKAKQYEWANISGKYKRETTDWKRLCTSCHRVFDNAGKKKGRMK